MATIRTLYACQNKQAEAAAGIEYSQSQYPTLSKFDDSFYAAQAQGYKIEALNKLDKIAEKVQASNGLQAVEYLEQLNDLAANPEFVAKYHTDAKTKAEFDKQLQQVVYLIQNENRATESVAFDRNLPTDNIAKLNAGLAYAEKGLEPVYPELWFWGTGSLLKSGITGLGKLGAGNSAKTISTNAVKLDSFASEKLLNEHFIKHSAEFKAKNASEYLKIGQDTINNGIPVKYSYRGTERTGYVQFLGNNSKGEAKFIFVGTNDAGKITTIHTKSGKDFWRTLNNNPKEKVIYPKD